nr:SDR family oxidoreductase [Naumannella cuiyingiana]
MNQRVIVVTGGNAGIGAGIVRACARQGARIVIGDNLLDDTTEGLLAEVDELGGEAVAVRCDVSRRDDQENLLATAIETWHRLDGWVSNAGIAGPGTLLEMTDDDLDRVLAVNLRGPVIGAQLAARRFIEQGGGGVIITTSSVHEDWPMPDNTPYCIAKGGVRMLTRNAALELGPHGIRMINVAPGAIRTRLNEPWLADPGNVERANATIPLGRVGEPDEIGELVAFLLSDRASYLTATTVTADAGLSQYNHEA